jgi:hypothetical protein
LIDFSITALAALAELNEGSGRGTESPVREVVLAPGAPVKYDGDNPQNGYGSDDGCENYYFVH